MQGGVRLQKGKVGIAASKVGEFGANIAGSTPKEYLFIFPILKTPVVQAAAMFVHMQCADKAIRWWHACAACVSITPFTQKEPG